VSEGRRREGEGRRGRGEEIENKEARGSGNPACVCVRREDVEAWRHAEATQHKLGIELRIDVSVD